MLIFEMLISCLRRVRAGPRVNSDQLSSVLGDDEVEDEYEKAEHVLIKKLSEIKDAQKLGIRPERVFREAAAKFLVQNMHLSTIGDIAITFEQLDPYIGHVLLKSIHDGTLAPFIADWKARGLSHRTINIAIARVRRVLRLAAMKWRDEQI